MPAWGYDHLCVEGRLGGLGRAAEVSAPPRMLPVAPACRSGREMAGTRPAMTKWGLAMTKWGPTVPLDCRHRITEGGGSVDPPPHALDVAGC